MREQELHKTWLHLGTLIISDTLVMYRQCQQKISSETCHKAQCVVLSLDHSKVTDMNFFSLFVVSGIS